MNKDYLRIQKIKEERLLLLKQARENILQNRDKENQQLGDILKVLNYDEDSLKKIVAYFKAKQLIASLVEDIANAESVDEVTKLRNKLNYYISKIKEELKYRNIGPVTKDSYNERLTSMREDISKYVRYLRRSNNLLEIDQLYSRYDNLNKEEMKRLKYLLRLEQSYNHRNLVVPEEKVIEEKEIDSKEIESKEEVQEELKEEIKEEKPSLKIDIPIQKKSYVVIPTNLNHVEFDDIKDQLDDRVAMYNRQYSVIKTSDYSNNKRKNFIRFLKNIPKFHHNKKSINSMQAAYTFYFRNNDLFGYMEYLRRRNSIKNNLKYIFSGSKISSNEKEALFRHKECSRWIYEFCKRHDMGIVLDKNYTK